MSKAILAQIESLGFVVKEFRANGAVELRAVPLKGNDPPQVARCNDGDGDDELYRAACLLAQAVGIDLEDG
jgi:hypothetical protein